MVKRFLVLFLVVSLVAFGGCSKKEVDNKEIVQNKSSTEATGSAIDDAGTVSEDIEDPATENALDDISGTLSDW